MSIETNRLYRHFKGKVYLVVGLATHTESGETLVTYFSLEDPTKIWARPINMFEEHVEKDGYSGPRFVLAAS